MCAYAAVATGNVRSNPNKAVKLGKVSMVLAVVGFIVGLEIVTILLYTEYADDLIREWMRGVESENVKFH